MPEDNTTQATETPEPPTVTALKVSMLDVLENLYDSIKENATTLAINKAEAEGTGRINPLDRDEFARQILATIAGILSEKVLHPYQLQTEYLEFYLEMPSAT